MNPCCDNYLHFWDGNYLKNFFFDKNYSSPPGKIQNFWFLAKTLPPQATKKVSSPPAMGLGKILIPSQNFGVKWHYVFLTL